MPLRKGSRGGEQTAAGKLMEERGLPTDVEDHVYVPGSSAARLSVVNHCH